MFRKTSAASPSALARLPSRRVGRVTVATSAAGLYLEPRSSRERPLCELNAQYAEPLRSLSNRP